MNDDTPLDSAEQLENTAFNKMQIVDKRQPGGRWYPAFGAPTPEQEEKYIERMILKDKATNKYYYV